MPRLNDVDMENVQLTGSYGYSAVGIEKLGSTEYTLVTILCDVSGSVTPFARQLEGAIQSIIIGCKGAREENILLRLVTFNTTVEEVHGFKPMETCTPASYSNILQPRGETALYDATENAVSSTVDFSHKLSTRDYTVNGAIYILTDGQNNSGAARPRDIRTKIENVVTSEDLDSLVTILIGLNSGAGLDQVLQKFKDDAGLSHYEGVGNITESSLRRMVGLVSRSISLQSQSLQGNSQPLTF